MYLVCVKKMVCGMLVIDWLFHELHHAGKIYFVWPMTQWDILALTRHTQTWGKVITGPTWGETWKMHMYPAVWIVSAISHRPVNHEDHCIPYVCLMRGDPRLLWISLACCLKMRALTVFWRWQTAWDRIYGSYQLKPTSLRKHWHHCFSSIGIVKMDYLLILYRIETNCLSLNFGEHYITWPVLNWKCQWPTTLRQMAVANTQIRQWTSACAITCDGTRRVGPQHCHWSNFR